MDIGDCAERGKGISEGRVEGIADRLEEAAVVCGDDTSQHGSCCASDVRTASDCASQRWVLPTMSVYKNVTIPVGNPV